MDDHHQESSSRITVKDHHQISPSTLYPNNKRIYNSLTQKSATPDDNTNDEAIDADEETRYYKGVRARVRKSISSASQRAQKLKKSNCDKI